MPVTNYFKVTPHKGVFAPRFVFFDDRDPEQCLAALGAANSISAELTPAKSATNRAPVGPTVAAFRRPPFPGPWDGWTCADKDCRSGVLCTLCREHATKCVSILVSDRAKGPLS